MSWPTDDLVKTELDAGTDNPANARAQILAIANKVSALISALQTNFPNIGGAVTSDHGELNKLDGLTASVAELNKLAGLGATTAELNEVDASAAAVANFASGLRTYVYNGNGPVSSFNALAALGDNAYESIGPTGSGATNIWTGMDVIPSGAKMALLRVRSVFSPTSASAFGTVDIYGRPTGATADSLDARRAEFSAFGHTSATSRMVEFWVPLDGSRRFDFKYDAAGATLNSVTVYLQGFLK